MSCLLHARDGGFAPRAHVSCGTFFRHFIMQKVTGGDSSSGVHTDTETANLTLQFRLATYFNHWKLVKFNELEDIFHLVDKCPLVETRVKTRLPPRSKALMPPQ